MPIYIYIHSYEPCVSIWRMKPTQAHTSIRGFIPPSPARATQYPRYSNKLEQILAFFFLSQGFITIAIRPRCIPMFAASVEMSTIEIVDWELRSTDGCFSLSTCCFFFMYILFYFISFTYSSRTMFEQSIHIHSSNVHRYER